MTAKDTTPRGDWWWLAAVPPLLAGFAVLWIAGIGSRLWAVHLAAIILAGAVAALGRARLRPQHAHVVTRVVLVTAVVALALPLLGSDAPPRRWLALGPMQLYVAPVVLPAALAVLGAPGPTFPRHLWLQVVPVVSALLLAAQPDASQATALLAGVVVAARRHHRPVSWLQLIGMTAAVAWTWTRPDPLAPVPYVEGVFALAWGVSAPAGAAVTASAVVFVAGLLVGRWHGSTWPGSIAAYYAVLYGCSVAGLTPAPLIGFGAGPVLGFGLVVGIAPMLRKRHRISHLRRPGGLPDSDLS